MEACGPTELHGTGFQQMEHSSAFVLFIIRDVQHEVVVFFGQRAPSHLPRHQFASHVPSGYGTRKKLYTFLRVKCCDQSEETTGISEEIDTFLLLLRERP
jgi:hypothetical protein